MPEPSPDRAPPAIGWYRSLCGLLAAAHGLLAYGGLTLAQNGLCLEGNDPEILIHLGDPGLLMRLGWILAATAAFFGLANLAFLFLPRRPWAYGVHLSNIIGAVCLCCPAPLALPLLLAWMKPQIKAWFGTS